MKLSFGVGVIVVGSLVICVMGAIVLLVLALEEQAPRLPKPRSAGIDMVYDTQTPGEVDTETKKGC